MGPTPLNSWTKAAALLLGLGPIAEEILKRLPQEQASALRQVMQAISGSAELAALQQQALHEMQLLLDQKPEPATAEPAQSQEAEPNAEPTAESDQAAQLRQRLQQLPTTSEEIVQVLAEIPPPFLAAALAEEQPRIIALVVNHLNQSQAAEVLKRLPPELRRETSLRLAQLQLPDPEIVQSILQGLVQKIAWLAHNPERALTDRQAERTAALLRQLDRNDRKEVLTALEQSDSALAARIKEFLYRLDDLLRLQDRSVQRVLAEVESSALVLAMKGATEAVREKVRKNLSRRAREALDEEMEFLGQVSQAQVSAAQKQLTDVMQRLDLAGELVFENE